MKKKTKTTKRKSSKKKTVIVHKFDFKSIYELVKHLVSNENTKNLKQTYHSLSFLRLLNKQTPLDFDAFKVDSNDPLYRITPFQPTSIDGNLAYGGGKFENICC